MCVLKNYSLLFNHAVNKNNCSGDDATVLIITIFVFSRIIIENS